MFLGITTNQVVTLNFLKNIFVKVVPIKNVEDQIPFN